MKNPAEEWEHLWHELLIDLWVIGLLFGAVAIYFMFRYRAKKPNDEGKGPKLTTAQAVGWALIPAFVFLADDFYLAAKGWDLWNVYRRVPEGAIEVKVLGSQWSWEFDYGDGVTSDILYVPEGKAVVLRMTSDDVIHSFFLPRHRVKEDIVPGRITYLWFLPKPGKTFATCTEYCGTGHSAMHSEVMSMPEKEFDAWLDGEKTGMETSN